MHDVLISYSSEDKMYADAICHALETAKIRCWVAPRDVPAGQDYPEAILEAIETARVMVLVISKNVNASQYVAREVERAVNYGLTIISFRTEHVQLSKNLEFLTSISHWLDALTPPLEARIDELVRHVEANLASDHDARKRPGRHPAHAPPARPGFGRGWSFLGVGPGLSALLVGTVLIGILALWIELIGPRYTAGKTLPGTEKLIHQQRWITYDPLNFDPGVPVSVSVPAVREELRWIRAAGFTGIITFSSRGAFAQVPELAKSHGLAVIMGIWDPSDRAELSAAVAKRQYVDGYAVGHNGLGTRYSQGELVDALQYVKFRTGRPVATTERLSQYLSNRALLGLGDWVFPDGHVAVKDPGTAAHLADAIRDARETITMATTLAGQPERAGRPVLLKMVTYPMAGVSNASLNEQRSFFLGLLESRRDTSGNVPGDVSIAVHSAFDQAWKREWPFYEWDAFTGILERDGAPRPAVSEITSRIRVNQ